MESIASTTGVFAFEEKQKLCKMRLRNLKFRFKCVVKTKEEKKNLMTRIFAEQDNLEQMHLPEVSTASNPQSMVNTQALTSSTASTSLSTIE